MLPKTLHDLLRDLNRSDAELNAVYLKLIRMMDTTARNKLIRAQRAWLVFRDANAELRADYLRGGGRTVGEGGDFMRVVAKIEANETRLRELKQIQSERDAATRP